MYFMLTVCISCRPRVDVHKGEGGPAHVDACGQGEGNQKPDYFVDVIYGWPLRPGYPSSYCTKRCCATHCQCPSLFLLQEVNISISFQSLLALNTKYSLFP